MTLIRWSRWSKMCIAVRLSIAGRNRLPHESICFVDDDPDEVRRFRRLLGGRFVVAAGTSLPEAVADLRAQGRERPDAFALDLYFPEGRPNTEDERSDLARAWAQFLDAKAALGDVLARVRQSPEGGLGLARRVATEFPGVPFAFFTRKGTLEDAIAALEAGAAAIVKKPDPDAREREALPATEAADAALGRELSSVVRGLERAMEQRGLNRRGSASCRTRGEYRQARSRHPPRWGRSLQHARSLSVHRRLTIARGRRSVTTRRFDA